MLDNMTLPDGVPKPPLGYFCIGYRPFPDRTERVYGLIPYMNDRGEGTKWCPHYDGHYIGSSDHLYAVRLGSEAHRLAIARGLAPDPNQEPKDELLAALKRLAENCDLSQHTDQTLQRWSTDTEISYEWQRNAQALLHARQTIFKYTTPTKP